jgi:hypothetical protein
MKTLLCALISMIAGCSTPLEKMNAFVDKYQTEPVKVVYSWNFKPTAPFTAFSDPPVIYIDWHWLHSYEHLHAAILCHEAGHAIKKDGKHCEKRTCLMYREIHALADMFGKRPCGDCKSKLMNPSRR